jgi:hypothetical protein
MQGNASLDSSDHHRFEATAAIVKVRHFVRSPPARALRPMVIVEGDSISSSKVLTNP